MADLKAWLEEIEREPDTFTVAVADGLDVTLRIPRSADELAKIEKGASQFVSAALKRPPAEWKQHAPKTEMAARFAYLLHRLAVEPEIGIVDALRLIEKKSLLVISLVTEAYRRAGAIIAEQEVAEIEQAGEYSGEITLSEPSG